MENEIINRVASSKLVTFDLEDYYPKGTRLQIDIKDWLLEGIVLREKDFREYVKNHDWNQYQDAYVALHCSTDAIVPAWAYMLMTISLESIAKRTILGDLDMLETALYQDIISNIDVSEFQDKPVIVKGCAKKPVPVNAYLLITTKLKTVAKSIMFGEACSSVPLFKRK
ncbi:DUF2480 family protein [Bizionia argentinensis JUB59]|uniref:DUF2480 family protein n=1 Tax=Bizionia argentinensis JUB59 TaxID=1046627 RepID=G2EH75_9FLAO|nr:DUF2480 family protein [Bizionia argentinensis]EGV42220.1 DUF2480 family protein [Bizionia argentinensis JUB59]